MTWVCRRSIFKMTHCHYQGGREWKISTLCLLLFVAAGWLIYCRSLCLWSSLSHTTLTHRSNWSLTDLSGLRGLLLQGTTVADSPLLPQLSNGTYHACLTGGSCHTACNKRLKYWISLSWNHNDCVVPVVITLHPSPFIPSGRSMHFK